MTLEWDGEKSEKLKEERGVSFEELARSIQDGKVLVKIPNPERLPAQTIYVVRHAGDVWAVPTEVRGDTIRLITAWPSRKLRKRYEKD